MVEDFETLSVFARRIGRSPRIRDCGAALREVATAAGAKLRLVRRWRDGFAPAVWITGLRGPVADVPWQSPSARLARLNFEQLREPVLASGRLTIEQFNEDVARLDERQHEWRSPILWTAWGQRRMDDSV